MRRYLNSDNFAAGIQLITDSIGDAILATDATGKIVFYNPAAKELLGVDAPAPETKVQDWTSLFGVFEEDKTTSFPTEKIPLVLAGQGVKSDNVMMFIRNHKRPEGVFISVTGRPILDAEAKTIGGVIVVRDISKEKKAEEEMNKANRQLAEENVELQAINSELEAFSYSVSHDLRAPLRSITGFSDILVKRLAPTLGVEELDYLTRIKDSGDTLGQLIDGLLDLSRLSREELNHVEVNLSDISKAIIKNLKNHEPQRKIVFEVTENLIARGDQRLIHSLLQNLISNAWKFSSKNPEAKVEIGSQKIATQQTVFFVKDNGAGFNAKYDKKLFNIFQRLHTVKEFDGNGIGLATVKRIINRHGGNIWAEGMPGEGATFYFTMN